MSIRNLAGFVNRQFANFKWAIIPHFSWLVFLPAGMWAIATQYNLLLAPNLAPLQNWAIAIFTALLAVLSLAGHAQAHRVVARWTGAQPLRRVLLFPFGDASQAWPAETSASRELAIILAGPIFSFALAGLASLVWNAQLNPAVNVSASFLGLFNVWLAIINLTPAYPADGGRLMRLALSQATGSTESAERFTIGLSYLVTAALAGWGGYLIAQGARYSLMTGLATLLLACLYLAGLLSVRTWNRTSSAVKTIPDPLSPLRIGLAGFLFLALGFISSTAGLTNNGIEAPGIALSVEPMVELPASYRHQPTGTFILTSVLSQAPIPLGGVYLSRLDPSVLLLPPEKLAPHQATPQESARQGFQMLDQSETTAAIVGLREAGFTVQTVEKGVTVLSLLPTSPNRDLLLPGDIISGVNGRPVGTTSALINLLKGLNPQDGAQLKINRDGRLRDVAARLLPPGPGGGAPKLGITVQDAGYDYQLPIPVKIVPQKIVGGPSAGLIFTLTVDNLLSPVDLTGGRKIAGTGTINLDGTVGPIGGVEQKVAAAEAAGAEYFLSPAENYAAALAVARRVHVVKVETVEQAIQFLKSLPPTRG